jgi:FtsH-binding integral membrane protein
LSNIEKQVLTNTLCEDQGMGNRDNVRVSWRQVYYVFIDWKIYLYVLINMGISGLIKYLTTYLPLFVQDMVSSESRVHLMAAPPYAFAFVCCLLISYSSSRRNERGFHLMFSLCVALLGFILMLTLHDRGKGALYVSICITCCGIFSALPLLLSWLTNNIDGHTKKSIAIAFVLALGQIGAIILPLVRLLLWN